MTTLGTHKKKYCFAARGILGPDDLISIIYQIIKVCGMTPARGCRVDTYPYLEKGGIGFTVYQPLMESYLVADVYTDLNETEILISTCKPKRMRPQSVLQIMNDQIGPSQEVKL